MKKLIRIGINALGPITQDTGGRTYLINFSKHLASVTPDVEWTFFVTPGEYHILHRHPTNYRFIEIPNTHHTFGRIAAEHWHLPELIRYYHLDGMYYPGNFASWNCPVPYVVAIRSMLIYNRPNDSSVSFIKKIYRKTVLPRSAQMSRFVITPSLHTKNEIVRFLHIPEFKIHVVPHGIDFELFHKPKNPDEAKTVFEPYQIVPPYILYVSALWEYKNHDKLILAYHRLRQRYQLPHQLIFVGQGMNSFEGYAQKIRQMIRTLQLEDSIRMIPFLPHESLVHCYQQADVFVFPSMTESFGNPIFEALAAGVPVLCSNTHAMNDLADDAAMYVDPSQTELFADKIYELITNTHLRQSLIEKGYHKTKTMSWNHCCQNTSTLILQAIS